MKKKREKTFLNMQLYMFRVCDGGDSLALQSGRPSTASFLSRGAFPRENEKLSTYLSLPPFIMYSCFAGNVSAS
jgi:hypothetical protein